MNIFKISLTIVFIGIACILFENYYYQYVGNEGLLHESLFLPIGSILIILGMIGVIFSLAVMFARKLKGKAD